MAPEHEVFFKHIRNCNLDIVAYQAIRQNLEAVRQRGKFVEEGVVLPKAPERLIKDMLREKFFKSNKYTYRKCRRLLVDLYGCLEGLVLFGPNDMLIKYFKKRYQMCLPERGKIIEFCTSPPPLTKDPAKNQPKGPWECGFVKYSNPDTGAVQLYMKNEEIDTIHIWSNSRLHWRYWVETEEEKKLSKLVKIQERQKPSEPNGDYCSLCYGAMYLPWRAIGKCEHTGVCANCALRWLHFESHPGKKKKCPMLKRNGDECNGDWSRVVFKSKNKSHFKFDELWEDKTYGILYEDLDTKYFFNKHTKFYCLVCEGNSVLNLQKKSFYECQLSQLVRRDGLKYTEKVRGLIRAGSDYGVGDEQVHKGELFLSMPTSKFSHQLEGCLSIGKTFRVSVNKIYIDEPDKSSQPSISELMRSSGSLKLKQRKNPLKYTAHVGDTILVEVTSKWNRDGGFPISVGIRLQVSTWFRNIDALNRHLRAEHLKTHCKLCVEANRLLIFQQRLYSPKELKSHNKFGTRGKDGLPSTQPHPKCDFCNEHFYDHEALCKHMEDQHYVCEVCQPKMGLFFRTEKLRFAHWEKYHWLCKHRDCVNRICPPVFASIAALRKHEREANHWGNTPQAKPPVVRPQRGPDVAFCFPEGNEPITDEKYLDLQRKNMQRFREKDKIRRRQNFFLIRSFVSKLKMPEFKWEELERSKAKFRNNILKYVRNDMARRKLAKTIDRFWAGNVHWTQVFDHLVVKILPFLQHKTIFDEILLLLLPTITDNGQRKDLYNEWIKMRFGRNRQRKSSGSARQGPGSPLSISTKGGSGLQEYRSQQVPAPPTHSQQTQEHSLNNTSMSDYDRCSFENTNFDSPPKSCMQEHNPQQKDVQEHNLNNYLISDYERCSLENTNFDSPPKSCMQQHNLQQKHVGNHVEQSPCRHPVSYQKNEAPLSFYQEPHTHRNNDLMSFTSSHQSSSNIMQRSLYDTSCSSGYDTPVRDRRISRRRAAYSSSSQEEIDSNSFVSIHRDSYSPRIAQNPGYRDHPSSSSKPVWPRSNEGPRAHAW